MSNRTPGVRHQKLQSIKLPRSQMYLRSGAFDASTETVSPDYFDFVGPAMLLSALSLPALSTVCTYAQ